MCHAQSPTFPAHLVPSVRPQCFLAFSPSPLPAAGGEGADLQAPGQLARGRAVGGLRLDRADGEGDEEPGLRGPEQVRVHEEQAHVRDQPAAPDDRRAQQPRQGQQRRRADQGHGDHHPSSNPSSNPSSDPSSHPFLPPISTTHLSPTPTTHPTPYPRLPPISPARICR